MDRSADAAFVTGSRPRRWEQQGEPPGVHPDRVERDARPRSRTDMRSYARSDADGSLRFDPPILESRQTRALSRQRSAAVSRSTTCVMLTGLAQRDVGGPRAGFARLHRRRRGGVETHVGAGSDSDDG